MTVQNKKFCLIQRSNLGQFYFSSATDQHIPNVSKVEITSLEGIPLEKQPTRLVSKPKVAKKTKTESLFASFAPQVVTGNLSNPDVCYPIRVEISTYNPIEWVEPKIYNGSGVEPDFSLDPVEFDGTETDILACNANILLQLQELQYKRKFSDKISNLELVLVGLLKKNLITLVSSKLYSFEDYEKALKFVKQYDACYRGQLHDRKMVSTNYLGVESFH
jgi:hypothetical protein